MVKSMLSSMSWDRSRGIKHRAELSHQQRLRFLRKQSGAEHIDRAVQLVCLRQFLPGQPGNSAWNEHFRNAIDEPPRPVRIQFGILECRDRIVAALRDELQTVAHIVRRAQGDKSVQAG